MSHLNLRYLLQSSFYAQLLEDRVVKSMLEANEDGVSWSWLVEAADEHAGFKGVVVI